MNEKLRQAFEEIQAEKELKNKTRNFIFQKTKGYSRAAVLNVRHILPTCACMLLLLFAGHWLYFTPTARISIDINPSLELGVNRFDRIVSTKGFNEDGKALICSLNLKFTDYSDAVTQILESADIVSLLSEDEIMTIAVVGPENAQSEEILSDIQSCTFRQSNTYCYHARLEEAEAARQAGLSCGKYRAFLELQKHNPDITVEEVRNMSMREIRDLIRRSSDGESGKAGHWGNGRKNRKNGSGHKSSRKAKGFSGED